MELLQFAFVIWTTLLLTVYASEPQEHFKRTRRYADKDCCDTYNAGFIRTHGRIWNTGVWKENFAAVDCPSMRCCDPKRVMAVRYIFIYTFQCVLRKRVIQPCVPRGHYIANTDLYPNHGFADMYTDKYSNHHGVFCCPGSKPAIYSGESRDDPYWVWTKEIKIQCV